MLLTGVPYRDWDQFTVFGVCILLCNGSSDLDCGQTAISGGPILPDHEEEDPGAYILWNWDDDDANDTPDYQEYGEVADEDNLAGLSINVSPAGLPVGSISLEVSPLLDLWTTSTKGERITARSWPSSDPPMDVYVEARNYTNQARDQMIRVTFSLEGKTTNDLLSVTCVGIFLADAQYREGATELVGQRGHAGLLFKYLGQCTKADLEDPGNCYCLEAQNAPLALQQVDMDSGFLQHPKTLLGVPAGLAVYWGAYTSPIFLDDPLPAQYRLSVLRLMYDLWENHYFHVAYGWQDCLVASDLHPDYWPNADLQSIRALRCDGLVELAYERSLYGLPVWAMYRDYPPLAGLDPYGYLLWDTTDLWSYSASMGTWDPMPNGLTDNLEEHNDFDTVNYR